MVCITSVSTNGSTYAVGPGVGYSATLPDSAGVPVDGRFVPKTFIRDASMVVNVVSIGKHAPNFCIGACDFYGGPSYVYDPREEEKRLPLVQVVKGQCAKFAAFPSPDCWREEIPPEEFKITVEIWLLNEYCQHTVSDLCLLNQLPISSAPHAAKSYAVASLMWFSMWLTSSVSL